MTWTNYYLRADDEAALKAAMPEYVKDDQWWLGCHHHTLDIIGPIVITPAGFDEDDNLVSEAVMDDRWHANLRLRGSDPTMPVPPEGVQIDAPTTPYRKWAGE